MSYMYTCIHAYVYNMCMYVGIDVCMYVCMYIYIYIYVYAYT